jgi:hypothetical protein
MKEKFTALDQTSFQPDAFARQELVARGLSDDQQNECYDTLAESIQRAELPLEQRLKLGLAARAAAELSVEVADSRSN